MASQFTQKSDCFVIAKQHCSRQHSNFFYYYLEKTRLGISSESSAWLFSKIIISKNVLSAVFNP